MQTARITKKSDGSITVESFTTFGGVVYRVGGFGLSANHDALAHRLCNAIEAGVVYENLSLAQCDRDVDGQSRASSEQKEFYVRVGKLNVIGRHMNADLKRLGF